MITNADAWRRILRELVPMPAQRVSLGAARGRYLSGPLYAPADMPPADRSAMDGFALRGEDLEQGLRRFSVLGERAAGVSSGPVPGTAETVRIYTGAHLPPGTDTVVPVEHTNLGRFSAGPQPNHVDIQEPVKTGQHVFRRGEIAVRGDTVLPAGTRLGPRQIAAAAACGMGTLPVREIPDLALCTTGAELQNPESGSVKEAQTYDSNLHLLKAAFAEETFPVVRALQVSDDLEATRSALSEAAQAARVIVTTGGVSMGRHDYVRPALEAEGAIIHFHGVAMKPGKPQLFATLPDGTLVFCLPGNPLSAAAGLYELILPALRFLSGCLEENCRPLLRLPLAGPVSGREDRMHLVPAALVTEQDATRLVPRPPVGSADVLAGGRVDGVILVDAGVQNLGAGTMVDFRPWSAP